MQHAWYERDVCEKWSGMRHAPGRWMQSVFWRRRLIPAWLYQGVENVQSFRQHHQSVTHLVPSHQYHLLSRAEHEQQFLHSWINRTFGERNGAEFREKEKSKTGKKGWLTSRICLAWHARGWAAIFFQSLRSCTTVEKSEKREKSSSLVSETNALL